MAKHGYRQTVAAAKQCQLMNKPLPGWGDKIQVELVPRLNIKPECGALVNVHHHPQGFDYVDLHKGYVYWRYVGNPVAVYEAKKV